MGSVIGVFYSCLWYKGSQAEAGRSSTPCGPRVTGCTFATLQDTGEDYDTAVQRLTAYFEPKKNVPFERHIFRSVPQMPDEPHDAFSTRLRQLVKSCDYWERASEMIRDQLVDKCQLFPGPSTTVSSRDGPHFAEGSVHRARYRSFKSKCRVNGDISFSAGQFAAISFRPSETF